MGKKSTLIILVCAIGLIGFLLPNQVSDSLITATSPIAPSSNPEPSSPEQASSKATVSSTATESEAIQVSPEQTAQPANSKVSLQGLILQLQVSAEVLEGYDRDLFKHWIDADSDGCNTRKEVLISEATVKPSVSSGCDLSGGQWYSPYDQVTTTDPSEFDIDHFVPLNEAWQSGAYSWSNDKRSEFANDLGFAKSLIAVTASSNRSKSDKDPGNWIPRNYDYLCDYVTSWVEVKIRWGLTADQPEVDALLYYSKGCD